MKIKKQSLKREFNRVLYEWCLDRQEQCEKTDPLIQKCRKEYSMLYQAVQEQCDNKLFLKMDDAAVAYHYQVNDACYRMGFWDGCELTRMLLMPGEEKKVKVEKKKARH